MDTNEYIEAGKNFYKAYNEAAKNVDNVMNKFDKQCAESKNITVKPGTLLYDCFGTIMNEAAKVNEAKKDVLNTQDEQVTGGIIYKPFGDNTCGCGDGGNGNYCFGFSAEAIEKLNKRTAKMMKERACAPFPIPPIEFIDVEGKWRPYVIFNGVATIVFWTDGTKTVVKCKEGTEYNAEEGLRWCIIKKLLADSPEFWNFIKGVVPEDKADKNKYSVWAKKVIAQAKHINKDLNA